MRIAYSLFLGFFSIVAASAPASGQANVNENLETAFIYVDTVNGSDSNPGTATAPLKTIGASVSLAEANNANNVGSRVIINPGVYRESVTVSPPHKSTNMPITFEAATNGTVYVSGAQQYTGWQVYAGNSNIYSNSWAYAWGLCDTLSAGAPAAPDIVLRREMVFVNGTPLTQVMSFNEVTVGTFYVDEPGSTIYMWPPAGTNVNTADVEVAVLPTLWNIRGQSDVVVRGLTFEYANTCRENGAVTVAAAGSISNVLFDSDNFLWNNAQGLNFGPTQSYFTVQNSVANHNGEAGFQATKVTDGLYQNDQSKYNNWRGAQGAYYSWNTAAAHFFQLHRLTVSNFEAAYNQTYAIHFDTDNANIAITSMTAYANLLSAALVEVNGGPVTFSNSTFCSADPLTGYSATVGFQLRDSMNVTMTGSNLVNSPTGVWVTGIEGGYTETNWETGEQYQAVNQYFTFTHNVVEGISGQQLFSDGLTDPDWTTFVTSLTSDSNTWWDASDSAVFSVPVPIPGTTDNFSTWQATTGRDANSVWATPSGNPAAACSGSPDMTDFWFVVPQSISPMTISLQTPAVFTATLVPFNFNGTAQLSYDGLQNIPGAVANWSANSLAPNQSANFTVTPASTTPGGTYPITLIANSGNITRTTTVLLTIDTTVQLSTTSLNFGNQLKNTTSAPQMVTLSNTSGSPLDGISISISGSNASNFTQTNNCPINLAANSSCTISVTFTPSNTGSRSATLSIYDADATSPQQVALSGTGTQPGASLSPSNLNFGNQEVGVVSASQTLTLTNTGTAALSITSIAVTGSNSQDFAETNNCGSTLDVNAICTVTVTFDPVKTGSRSAKIKVTDNASPATQTTTLSGTGIQSKVKLSSYSLYFGSQVWKASSATKVVTVTNSGTANLNITSVAVTGSNPGDFAETNDCGNSVAPNGTCSINVTFTPTALGTRSANVNLTDNAPSSPQTVSLNGTGITSVSFTPKSLNFGSHSVGKGSSPKNVTVTNLGTSKNLSITSLTFSGSNPGDFTQTNTCSGSLGPGKSCTVSVTFTPAKSGSRSATLNINDNDPASPQQVSLTGSGT